MKEETRKIFDEIIALKNKYKESGIDPQIFWVQNLTDTIARFTNPPVTFESISENILLLVEILKEMNGESLETANEKKRKADLEFELLKMVRKATDDLSHHCNGPFNRENPHWWGICYVRNGKSVEWFTIQKTLFEAIRVIVESFKKPLKEIHKETQQLGENQGGQTVDIQIHRVWITSAEQISLDHLT